MILLVGVPGTGKTTLLRAMVRQAAARGSSCYVLDWFSEFRGRVVTGPPFPRAAAGTPVVYRPAVPPLTVEGYEAAREYADHVDAVGGVLVLDEVWNAIEPRARLARPYARLTFQGRKAPAGTILAAAQRLTMISPAFRGVVKLLYLFRQVGARDLAILAESVPPIHRESVIARAANLPDLHYLRVDLTGRDARPIPIRKLSLAA